MPENATNDIGNHVGVGSNYPKILHDSRSLAQNAEAGADHLSSPGRCWALGGASRLSTKQGPVVPRGDKRDLFEVCGGLVYGLWRIESEY